VLHIYLTSIGGVLAPHPISDGCVLFYKVYEMPADVTRERVRVVEEKGNFFEKESQAGHVYVTIGRPSLSMISERKKERKETSPCGPQYYYIQ
jgi:hypothetical protein